jgi:membrane dipeptidase
MIPVFDGHNDTLLRLVVDPARPFATRADEGHIDAVRAAEGGLVGGLFAMFAPPEEAPFDRFAPRSEGASGDAPSGDPVAPAGPIDPDGALRLTLAMLARLRRLEAEGAVRVCASADEVEAARHDGVLAAVPHLEGAEAIVDLGVLESLHALGLRSLGPVWSRPNAYATGVPFAFPGSPDVGPGLTARGHELVRACDRLRILLDVSHLNEAGFWDLLATSERPVVASHSNAHALCASPRNLTDAQLDALAERDGLVGLNFAVAFLRADGGRSADTPVETMVRHLDHLVDRMGEDRVGLGSDFDGTTVPGAIGDVAGLPVLLDALAAHGWDDATIRKVAYGNWLSLLRRVQEA